MTRRAQGVLAAAAVLLAVAVAAVVVATASSGQRPMQQRVNEVAQGLKCPTCEAESVAASNTPIAQSMRRQIRTQLSHGRSPAQVRSWFEARYGAQVLLTPPTSGTGLLLWAVPVVALVAGGTIWVTADRRRRARTATAAGRPSPAAPLSPARVGVAAVALLVVGAAVPVAVWARTGRNDAQPVAATTGQQPAAGAAAAKAGGSKDWTAVAQTLEDQHDYAGAVKACRRALEAHPGSAALTTRLAFDLLRAGRPAQAARSAVAVAHRPGEFRPLGLLVLGLAQRQQHDPAADRTLRTFLDVAPHHPAAGQVRRLLGGAGCARTAPGCGAGPPPWC